MRKVQFIFATEIIMNSATCWEISYLVHCQTRSELETERNKARSGDISIGDALDEEYSGSELELSVTAWEQQHIDITNDRTTELEERWGSLGDFHTRYEQVHRIVNDLSNKEYPLYEITYPGNRVGYTDDPNIRNGVLYIREKKGGNQWNSREIVDDDLSKYRNFLGMQLPDGPWQQSTLLFHGTQGRK